VLLLWSGHSPKPIARGISFSPSTAYHPTGNSQCERFKQSIWRTIQLLLHAHNDSEHPPNTDSFPETDGVGGDDMGDVAADEADGVRGEGKMTKALFQRTLSVTVYRLCRAGLPVDANPLMGVVLTLLQIEWGKLLRLVCCCIVALMSLSRNVDCCHDRSGQLAFVFHGEC